MIRTRTGRPRAIVIDIDGVVMNSDKIFQDIYNLKLKGNDMWEYFYKNCNDSRKVPIVQNILPLLSSLDPAVYVILSTARNELCRMDTERRLHEENFLFDFLYMRNSEDYRPSPEVKADHLDIIKKHFDIICFIDDDLSNCEMAKSMGVLSLRKI